MSRLERRGKWLFLSLGLSLLACLIAEGVLTLLPIRDGALRSPGWWASVVMRVGFAAWPVYVWVRRWETVRWWLTCIGWSVAAGVLITVIRRAAEDPAGFEWSAAPVVRLAVAVLMVVAGVVLLVSPAVRAYLRFRHTGMSDDSDEALERLKPKVFISYRRDDAREAAGRLCDRLRGAFGKENVFIDVDHIPLGSRFPKVLRERMSEASVVLVVIGPNWVAAADAAGRKRLDDPDDWVRQEVVTAMELARGGGRVVVPVTVTNAVMPRRDDLPDPLRPLIDHQGMKVRPDPDFHRDAEGLIGRLTTLAADGGLMPTKRFELLSDRPFDPARGEGMAEAHELHSRLVAAVAPRPLRIIGWDAVVEEPAGKDKTPKYRVRCEAGLDVMDALQTAQRHGHLDRLTGVRWTAVLPVGDDGGAVDAAFQTPLAMTAKYREQGTEGDSMVCLLSGIDYTFTCPGYSWTGRPFEADAEAATEFVGETTRDPEMARVYITRKWVWPVFGFVTYLHSNFIKPGFDWPTKITTTGRYSLFTLFRNLVYHDGAPPDDREAEELHRDRVQYFVNERTVGKGNAVFYAGARNVRFVTVNKKG